MKSVTFEINEKLKKAVLENMPKGYSNLEKALYIYGQLCQKLEYSYDYFLDETSHIDFFIEPDNIKLIDGLDKKEVVCYTFNPIFLQMLVDEGICDKEVLNQIKMQDDVFAIDHESLTLSFDDEDYTFDSTKGVIDNNDLVLSQYGPSFEGCYHLFGTTEKLRKAKAKVSKEFNKLIDLEQAYKLGKRDELLELPFEERAQMFLEMATYEVGHSMRTLNYLIKLKHLMFTICEYAYSYEKNFDLIFTKNKSTKRYDCFVFINPKANAYAKEPNNSRDLEIYQLALDEPRVEKITTSPREFLKEYIESHMDREDDDRLPPIPDMLKVFNDEKALDK